MTRGRAWERGIALVVVLLVLSVLLAVVAEFALTMRLEATTTLNFRSALAASHLAEAGYQRAVAEILPDALAHQLDERGLLTFRRTRLEPAKAPERTGIPLGPGRFSYRITDEASRLTLNRATPDILHRLLGELGVERETRDVIVDSILDWRDANEEHRLNGAESDHYLGLPVPYRAKNGDFDSVEELLQVRGMTPEIFYGRTEAPGLAEYVTAAGPAATNVNTASDVVLKALRFEDAEIALLKQGRPYTDLSALPSHLRGRGRRLDVKSATFRIEAWGEVPDQGRRTLSAVIHRHAGRDGASRVTPLAWRWRAEEPSAPGGAR